MLQWLQALQLVEPFQGRLLPEQSVVDAARVQRTAFLIGKLVEIGEELLLLLCTVTIKCGHDSSRRKPMAYAGTVRCPEEISLAIVAERAGNQK